jgi:hypothetical protein
MPRTTWYLKASRAGYRCFAKQNNAGTIARTKGVPHRARPPEAETGNAGEEQGMSGLTLFGLVAVTLMLVLPPLVSRNSVP